MPAPDTQQVAFDSNYYFWSRGAPAALATSAVMAMSLYFIVSVVAEILP